MESCELIQCAFELDKKGLVWCPEIGDEVVEKPTLEKLSILVDPHGLTPSELRETFLWIPTVEQMIAQFEARQALIYHVGINNQFSYEAVIKTSKGVIEVAAHNLRLTFGRALNQLLGNVSSDGALH
jgi:hypothetical protein